MITIDAALSNLLQDVKTITATEPVNTLDAHHRVLADAQKSTINVPPADVSAMDGYAIVRQNVETNKPYDISQRIAAGHPAGPLAKKSVARLFTGSEIPAGADTVVIQENAEQNVESNTVAFTELPEVGANIRRCGQDIRANSELLPQGHQLLAQDLGLLASVGIEQVNCYRRLRIGVLSSGDELIDPGQTLAPGQIYNSNRFTLNGLINSLHMEFVNLGHVADDLNATIDALKNAADTVDLIITTGGVSVGEEDHIKNAVQTLGELSIWKLAIKPGKPLAFGKIGSTPLFGLPGNPVAVFVTFLMVVRPYLLAMQGALNEPIEPLHLPCDFTVEKPSPRQEYRRVRINQGKITEYHTQDSGVLTSTHWANALAVIPIDTTVAKGDLLQVYPFSLFSL